MRKLLMVLVVGLSLGSAASAFEAEDHNGGYVGFSFLAPKLKNTSERGAGNALWVGARYGLASAMFLELGFGENNFHHGSGNSTVEFRSHGLHFGFGFVDSTGVGIKYHRWPNNRWSEKETDNSNFPLPTVTRSGKMNIDSIMLFRRSPKSGVFEFGIRYDKFDSNDNDSIAVSSLGFYVMFNFPPL